MPTAHGLDEPEIGVHAPDGLFQLYTQLLTVTDGRGMVSKLKHGPLFILTKMQP